MDYEPRGSYAHISSYSEYYSTGGRYRPPKEPRNYGWMVAMLGVFLLCVAAGVTLTRGAGAGDAEADLMAQVSEVQPAVTEMPTATPAETPAAASEAVLGSGMELSISGARDEAMTLQEIYKKLIPSVASITALTGTGKSTGTGIVMSADGYIITNYHVASGARSVSVLLSSGEEYAATLVGGDETSDLMVLKIEAEDLQPAEFGDSDTVEVGDSVVAIGDPLGIELRGTMTDGIICGIQRDIQVGDRTMNLIQTNAALNSGNSGGPLVNMAGQVIGINAMKLSSGYTAVEGIGFAIPISTAKPIVDELVEKGYVTGRPAFGFTVEVLDATVVLFYDLPGRLYITSVQEDSDAYQQGIRRGDIIVGIDDVRVSSLDEFNAIKNKFSAGDTVTITVYRQGGQEAEFDVTLMDRADLH